MKKSLKNSNFDWKLNFLLKIQISSRKIQILTEKLNFWQKIQILTEKFKFWLKNSIFYWKIQILAENWFFFKKFQRKNQKLFIRIGRGEFLFRRKLAKIGNIGWIFQYFGIFWSKNPLNSRYFFALKFNFLRI